MAQEYPKLVHKFKGLRPNDRFRQMEQGFLQTCTNLRVSGDELLQINQISNSITGATPTQSWPWPQIFQEGQTLILFFSTTVWTLVRSTQVATQITTYDALTPASTKAIPSGGGVWHFAGFDQHWIATKGNCHVFKFAGNSLKTFVVDATSDITTFQSCANVNGALVVGGMAGTYLINAAFVALYDLWRDIQPAYMKVSDEDYTGTNVHWLLWEKAGGSDTDYPFWGLMHMVSNPGTSAATAAREVLLSLVDTRRIGFVALPCKDTVKCIKALGKGAIVYSADKIMQLDETEHGYVARVISDIGITGRGAVCGDNDMHLAVTSRGMLYKLDSNGLENLRYDELDTLTGANISMVWNEVEREAYISDGTLGYIWTEGGLSKTTTLVSAILEESIGVTNGASTPNAFTIITNETDLASRGLKVVNFVSWKTYNCTDMIMNFVYKFDSSSTWLTSEDIYGGEDGEFYIGIACTEFRLKLRGTAGTDAAILGATAHVQYRDSPTTRGPRGTGVGQSSAAAVDS